jgi:hypothetical protein
MSKSIVCLKVFNGRDNSIKVMALLAFAERVWNKLEHVVLLVGGKLLIKA